MKNLRKSIIISIIVFMLFISNCVQANNIDNWEEWQNENYWEWYTRTTTDDKAYNGKHIVIDKDVINFYGYWQNSYKDFLYKEYNRQGKKIFKFRIDESKASYHTLDGAGFIFNASKIDNKLSGYVLLFREKDVCLYRIDNVNINTFQTASNTTLDTYGKLIESKPKLNSNIHDLIIEATPTNIKVTEGNSEIINIDLDYSKHVGDSFGLISSYVQHACEILSKIEFSELKIEIEDFKVGILNTDLDGNSIAGGYFEIRDEEGSVVKEGRTDENGNIVIEGIKQGNYTVKQITPPETYILNDTIYEFKVTANGKVVDVNSGEEIELIIRNEQLKIEINNKVINTENPIPGSTIGLYDNNGKQVMTAITDAQGVATFTGITEGDYTYKQIDVPDGYELNDNEYKCTVNIDGTVEFNRDNKNTIYNKEIEEKSNVTNSNNIVCDNIDNTTNNVIDNTISKTNIPNAGKDLKIYGLCIILTIIFSMVAFMKMKNK